MSTCLVSLFLLDFSFIRRIIIDRDVRETGIAYNNGRIVLRVPKLAKPYRNFKLLLIDKIRAITTGTKMSKYISQVLKLI